MRLRLEILRYQLPPVRILWQADPEQTVCELLHAVDPLVPLESEYWGLEDYVAEVEGGFEGLHYHTIGDVLKEDEHIRIRPLTTNDHRARRLTGRAQIDNGGRRILDGIAYGRPLLKSPVRPRIRIPALKRAELGSDCERNPLNLSSDDEDDDGEDDNLEASRSWDSSDDEYAEEGGTETATSIARRPTRQSAQLARARIADEIDLDESGDDAEVAKRGQMVLHTREAQDDRMSANIMARNAKKSTPDSLLKTKGSSGRKRVHWQDEEDKRVEVDDKDSTTSTSDTDSDSDSSSASSSDLSSSDSEEEIIDAGADARPSKRLKLTNGPPAQPPVPPGQGKLRTRQRNERRKAAKQLTVLKREGVLSPDAGKKDLKMLHGSSLQSSNGKESQSQMQINGVETNATTRLDGDDSKISSVPMVIGSSDSEDDEDFEESESEDDVETSSSSEESSSGASSESEEDVAQLDREVTKVTEGDVKPDEVVTTLRSDKLEAETKEFCRRREALLKEIDGGGIDITHASRGHTNGHVEQPITNGASAREPITEHASSEKGEGERKKRLDIKASQRLLLGSLGHRAPRTAQERANLTAKLGPQPKKKDTPKANGMGNKEVQVQTAEAEASEDPDYWKSRIELSAVECCGSDIPLSTPPFPFYQRWDPSQKKGKKRKRNSYQNDVGDYGEENFGQDENSYFGNGDALDYDEETAGGEEQRNGEWQGFEDAAEEFIDDMPALPENVTSLPPVLENEVMSNDILVFRNLECSAATNWAPAYSPVRTAKVLTVDTDNGVKLKLQLARRDLPRRKYDEEGDRIYEKFEMDVGEDGTEDDTEGTLSLPFIELVEPRLLASAADSQNKGNHGEASVA